MVEIYRRIVGLLKRKNHVEYARWQGVKVGENCNFVDNPNWGSEPWLIEIGNHVLLSSAVSFVNHDVATWVFREKEGKYHNLYKFGKIKIGNNCFIGTKSIIMPNIEIGNDCIIAAGSIVTKDIPAHEVWGGVPAKYICSVEDYAEKCLKNKLPYDDVKINTDKKREMLRVLE